MRSWRRSIRPQSRRNVLLVLLLIGLLLFAVSIQAVHTHPDGAFHSNCALCAAAHAAMAIIVSVAFLLALEELALFFRPQEKVRSRFLIPFALSIRPPPPMAFSLIPASV